MRDRRREALGQRPSPAADLQHYVVPRRRQSRGRSRRAGSDRGGSSGRAGAAVRPGAGRSPSEDPRGVRLHQRARAPRRSTRAPPRAARRWPPRSRGGSACRASAAGEERRVGLDQEQLVGDAPGRLAKLLGLRVGEVAGERAVPAVRPRPRRRARAVPRSSGGSPSPRPPRRRAARDVSSIESRMWITSGLPSRRAIPISALGRRRTGHRAAPDRGRSRARSRRSPPTPESDAELARCRPRRRRRSPPPSSGWRPTAAVTSSWSAAERDRGPIRVLVEADGEDPPDARLAGPR